MRCGFVEVVVVIVIVMTAATRCRALGDRATRLLLVLVLALRWNEVLPLGRAHRGRAGTWRADDGRAVERAFALRVARSVVEPWVLPLVAAIVGTALRPVVLPLIGAVLRAVV
jgi:hypothetical protein